MQLFSVGLGYGRIDKRKQMVHNFFMQSKLVPLKAHVSVEKKIFFSALAAQRGMSTSRLLSVVIDAVLQRGAEATPPEPKEKTSDALKTEALATRVTSAEWAKIETELKARKTTTSGFLRLLLQAYFTKGTVFDPTEVAALREANMSLAKVGRLLNQGIKHLATNPYADPKRALPEEMLKDLEAEVRTVRKQIEDLLAQNLRSWGNNE